MSIIWTWLVASSAAATTSSRSAAAPTSSWVVVSGALLIPRPLLLRWVEVGDWRVVVLELPLVDSLGREVE